MIWAILSLRQFLGEPCGAAHDKAMAHLSARKAEERIGVVAEEDFKGVGAQLVARELQLHQHLHLPGLLGPRSLCTRRTR